jgi:hypothetical protein
MIAFALPKVEKQPAQRIGLRRPYMRTIHAANSRTSSVNDRGLWWTELSGASESEREGSDVKEFLSSAAGLGQGDSIIRRVIR